MKIKQENASVSVRNQTNGLLNAECTCRNSKEKIYFESIHKGRCTKKISIMENDVQEYIHKRNMQGKK